MFYIIVGRKNVRFIFKFRVRYMPEVHRVEPRRSDLKKDLA